MRSKTIIVNVKLTPAELRGLDLIIGKSAYETRSAVLRAGLGMLFEKLCVDNLVDRDIEYERRIHRPRSRRKAKKVE